ncbi:MAG TPA: hypothetical protein VF268_11470 [Gammaproteobacteria bacterium]
MNPEKRMKEIDKKILMISIINLPGAIMFGLGLYAKFAVNGNAFIPLLNDQRVADALLVIGAVIMVWGGYQVFTLGREKARLVREGGGLR